MATPRLATGGYRLADHPPEVTGKDSEAIVKWVRLIFDTQAKRLNEPSELRLEVQYTPPEKPREGQIIYADGAAWNPGSGEGPYYYTGSIWVAMIPGAGGSGPVDWTDVDNKPTTFPPGPHTHPESDVVSLVSDLALKAPLASPIFTGNPTAPTPAPGDNDTSIATTAYVTNAMVTAGATQTAAETPFTPSGTIAANNVQSAIVEVNAENVAKTGDTMTGTLTVPLVLVSGPTPQVRLTDTDTGAVNYIDGNSTTGSLTLRADQGDTVANSSILFYIDAVYYGSITPTNWNIPTYLHVSSSSPAVYLTDTDTGARNMLSGSSSVGSLTFACDMDSAYASSTINFTIDGVTQATMNHLGTLDVAGALLVGTGDAFSVAAATGNITTEGSLTVNGNVIYLAGTSPQINLTDTDTGADSGIHASATTGSMYVRADYNNEVAGSIIGFQVDGATVGTAYAGGVWDFVGQITPASVATGAITGTTVTTSGFLKTTNGTVTAQVAIATGTFDAICTDAGVNAGPIIWMRRDSASPAIFDDLGYIGWRGNDSTSVETTLCDIKAEYVNVTNGSEAAQLVLRGMNAGVMSSGIIIRRGMVLGAPAGGDKGDGTINCSVAVYDDGVVLTCMALSEQFRRTGKFDDADLAEWDAKVPPIIHPAQRIPHPVMDRVEVTEITRDKDGTYRRIKRTKEVQRVAYEPVYDEDGCTGVDMIEEPMMEMKLQPERIEPRPHHTARVFKDMIDSGFDPRDPRSYFDKMREREALPGMPSKAEWVQNEISVGEMISRLWLTVEMLATATATMYDRSQTTPVVDN